MRKLAIILVLVMTSIAAFGQAAYNLDKDSGKITVSGGSVPQSSSTTAVFVHPNRIGELNQSVELLFSGSPNPAVVSIYGCGRGNLAAYGSTSGLNGLPTANATCIQLDSYTTTTSAASIRLLSGLYDSYQVTSTLTGGSSPAVQVNWLGSAYSTPAVLPFQFVNITTNTSTQIKSQPGFLHQVIISTKGATANQVVLFDNTACSGAKIATVDTTAQGASFAYDVQFNIGLCALTQTGTAGDITISYR